MAHIARLYVSVLLTSLLLNQTAIAQRGGGGGNEVLSAAIEWDKRAEVGDRLTAHGLDLLGDSIDPHMGTISFRQTDISLPGNSGLSVALTRELTPGYFHSFSVDAEFGDWNYSVPRLHVVTAVQSSQQTDHWVGTRCSDPQAVFDFLQYYGASGPNSYAYPVEYSNGLLLDVPGYGSQQVLNKSPTIPVPVPFPTSAKFVTAQNWYLTCGSASDGGEGFIAIAPNGDRYRFDRYVQHAHRNLGAMAQDGGNAGGSRYIARVKGMLMATEVTDVHGNWVRYDYDAFGRLTQIHANDGRAITLGYNGSSKVVATATANGRTWNYGYDSETISDYYTGDYGNNKQILSTVTLPDSKSWSFDLLNMHRRATTGTLCENTGGSMSLTHPDGVTGTYAISENLHRNGFADWMVETTLRCAGFVNPREPTYYDIYHLPIEVMSVTQKTISGPNMPTSQWDYTYENDVDEVRYPVGHQYEGHPIATSENDPTNWTKVLNPDGSEVTYYHFFNYLNVPNIGGGYDFGGKLDRQETRSTVGSTVLETIENHYVKTGVYGGSYIPSNYAGNPPSDVIFPVSTGRPVRFAKTVTKRDGDTFTTELSYNTTQSSPSYSYGNPIQSKVFSNVSTAPRTTDITYEHNMTEWVLALPKTVEVNNRPIDVYNYDSNGSLEEHWRYGVLVTSYDRYATGIAAGRISAAYDGLNRKTELLDWHRGTPQRIKRADNESIYQYVDDNGWMTSSNDARGNVTGYSRDNMGRLTLIDPPGIWDNTSVSYNFAGGGAVQTITKGQAKTTITYDPMFRPILERSEALDTGWSSYVNTDYDTLGRVAFKSQPSTSATTNAGVNYSYDGLGRTLTETESVTPFAETRHEYFSLHKHRVIDPADEYMDYYSYGYDGPGNNNYSAMYHSSGQNTDIHQNIWGETERVQQSGTQGVIFSDQSQYYYYDANRRLCRQHVPEGGDTVYSYDDAGQMTAYQKGLSTGTTCDTPTGTVKVSLSYDSVGRLTTTDFSDAGTPDITRTYDADSNALTINRSGVNWTYVYNELNLLVSEALALDARNYPISYLYNSSGQTTRQTLPTGRQINYTPDGLGRHKTIKDGAATLASNTNYHPSGAVSSMTYGNGQLLTQTLNARLLPLRLLSVSGAQTAIDQTFTYDVRGNLTGLVDGAVVGNNRTNGYDALSRITTASGPWGAGSYTYDVLGNLRIKTLGSRSVTLSYDASNRLTQSVDTGPGGTRSLAYDARGNATNLGALTFVYDYSDQPVSVSGSASGTYRYDGNRKRVKSVTDGKTIYNVYDVSGSLVHVDEVTDGNTTDYVSGPSGSLARIENNVVTYLHPDYLGSAQSGTNSSGIVAWREQYTPFGEELQSPAANDDQAGYTGHIKDSATGLNYMQARYYDPTIGRFLSIDPVEFTASNPMSFNRYLYVNNNPHKYNDPDGEFLNFAVKFVADVALNVAINYATTGEANLGGALKESAVGALNPASTLKKIKKVANLVADARKAKVAKTCCFVAGTLVDTEAGLRPIENIGVGDKVWSKDVETGKIALKAVTDLIPRHERQIWVVDLSGQDGRLSRFETTNDHPWWISNLGWVTTEKLAVGMVARSKGDLSATIINVQQTRRKDAVYNLTIADYETYFVGDARILVHNCNIRMKDAGTSAERTKGSMNEVKEAVADAGFDKNKLNCAKCKLETSVKNRKAENARRGADPSHTKRIKDETQQLEKVNRRLEELD